MKEQHIRLLLVDSYEVTERYLLEAKKIVTTVYMDDLCENAYFVDAVVNYNIFADREKYCSLYRKAGVPTPRLLLGTEYAPVRQEFARAREIRAQKTTDCVRKVLILTGGSDFLSVANRLLAQIAGEPSLSALEYHVVIGPYTKVTVPDGLADRVVLHRNVKDMGQLMAECDVAVSAAGVTLYELCAVGIPTVCYSVADNQRPAVEWFERKGLMCAAADARDESASWAEQLKEALKKLCTEEKERKQLKEALCEMDVSGGADRLVRRLIQMMEKEISIVIPCYQVERYLDRCLQSLAEQTLGLSKLQLILVDDASTDRTGRKLDWWQAKYPDSVEVIHLKENRRQGGARNAGLLAAMADTVGFVDSDDWVDADMYRILLEKQKEKNYDFVHCYAKRTGDTREKGNKNRCKDVEMTVGNEEERKEFLLYRFPSGIWGSLFSASFLRSFAQPFPEHMAYEDNYWMAVLKMYAKSCLIVGQELYYYYVNPQSTILASGSVRHLDRLVIEEKKLDWYEENGFFKAYAQEIEYVFLKMYYINSLHTFFARFENVTGLPFDRMKKTVLKRFPNYRNNRYLSRLLPLERELLKTVELTLSYEEWQRLATGYRKAIAADRMGEEQ